MLEKHLKIMQMKLKNPYLRDFLVRRKGFRTIVAVSRKYTACN
jgi:hypothetical protein